jgi:hypothetical protein
MPWNTIAAKAIGALVRTSKGSVSTIMTDLGVGPDYNAQVPASGGMDPSWDRIEQALNRVISALPDEAEPGQPSKRRFVELTVALHYERTGHSSAGDQTAFAHVFEDQYPSLCVELRASNLTVDEVGQLVALVPGVAGQELSSWLERKIGTLAWRDAEVHLREALRTYADGQWGASNASLRSFLQEVFDRLHAHFHTGCAASGGAARQHLTESGLIQGQYENNLIRHLFHYLGSAGSHAGASDRDESAYHHNLALSTATFYLLRCGL